MSRKPYLAALLLAALLALGAVLYSRSHAHSIAAPTAVPPSLSGPVPRLSATALAGQRVSLAADRGRPMLINFFASWCNPCKQEAPALATLGRDFAGRVTMLAVSTDGNRSQAAAFVHRYGWSWPVVMDGGLTWANAFKITGQPWTFLVNRQGEIVWKHPGPISLAAVRGAIDRLLKT